MKPRVPSTAVLLSLGAVLAAFAFQWGQATAARQYERRRTAVVEAVAHAAPAVVSVEGVLGRGHSRGAGSGVIVHPQGYVVTNSHVIRGARSITVKPFQSGQRHPARVVVDDPNGDLALLQIQGNRRWPYVSLCSSQDVHLGETAVAIGNPRGLGDSITVGVVSAKGRQGRIHNGAVMRNLIQTDASINSGNSGGPLLNLDGELLGVNASLLPSANGIAFAIPADNVQTLLRRVLGRCAPPNPLPPPDCEEVPPPVSPDRPTPSVRRPVVASVEPESIPLRPSDVGLLIEDDGRQLIVRRVTPGSAAAKAGVAVGDVLLEVDGFAVEAVDEVRLAFAGSRPGRIYDLRVRRSGASRVLSLVVPR